MRDSGGSDADDVSFVEIDRTTVRWRFEPEFLSSNWTCLFGRGCKGILDHDAEDLNQGCCSLGAHFGDGDAGEAEAMHISAMAAMIPRELWQYHAVGTTPWRPEPGDGRGTDEVEVGVEVEVDLDAEGVEERGDDPPMISGYFGDDGRTHTRVVDGACVFLNRPGFEGGEGCALHLAALDAGESPIEWKPSVCWQLPLRVDWQLVDPDDPSGPETATVRRWSRADWGDHGRTMAWCCTERSDGGEAYSGDQPVVVTLRDELIAVCDGDESLYDELVRRLSDVDDDRVT